MEYEALKELCIESNIFPSFLGDINQFDVSYETSKIPKVYTSVSGGNFQLYGWDKIPELAKENPEVEFHLYGAQNADFFGCGLFFGAENIIHHGRVPKERMNEEIKEMQGALRLTEFDGFSEILAKSILMGQWPVSLIPYSHMLGIEDLGKLKDKKQPNFLGRNHYRKILNQFPWNQK